MTGIVWLSLLPPAPSSSRCAPSMWIMVAGPYRTGARTDEERAGNLRVLNAAAYEILQLGHVPVIGVNLVLPIVDAAGEEHYDEIMLPLSLALAERCDAVVRVGGASTGADREVERIRERGGILYGSVAEVPRLEDGRGPG